MDNYTKLEFSKFQNTLLVLTSIVFILLVWNFFSVDDLLKAVICIFLCSFILLMVTSFARYLGYLEIAKTAQKAVSITMLVFVAFPLVINIMHSVHEKDYLVSCPVDNKISARISCDVDRVGGTGSIGKEWTYKHFLNDKEFENGEVVVINVKSSFTITSECIERDSIPDVGTTTSKQIVYPQGGDYKKPLIISQKVHVVEKGGRRYAGSTADFVVTYTITRVIPTTMGYWEVFLHTSNDTEYFFCVLLIVGLMLSSVCVVFVLVKGNRKKAYIEEQERVRKKQEAELERNRIAQELEKERQRKEREFLTGRAGFLESLQGQSIRQAAGVPNHISFVKGLPKDNNDALYGSFTVYCSTNGSCYHDRMGCCSARRPMHYFNVKKKLRPCSKCCTKQRTIPQWYTDYNALINQAKRYRIDISE